MANTFQNFVDPVFRAFLPTTNLPAVGGKVFSYVAGTSFGTAAPLYTDPACTVPATNPVILDSNGSAILYGNQLYDLKVFDASSNLLYTVLDVFLGMTNISSATISQWSAQAGPFTYLTGTTFSVVGDQRTIYDPGRRVQFICSGGTGYATIQSSVFGSGVTTVTLINDAISLDSGLSAVSVGVIDAINQSLPIPQTIISALNGIIRVLGLSSTGPIRERFVSNGAGNSIYQLLYNTSWTGSAFAGRDIADICWRVDVTNGILSFYTAVTGGAGTTPTFVQVFKIDASGNETITGALVVAGSITGVTSLTASGTITAGSFTPTGGTGQLLSSLLGTYYQKIQVTVASAGGSGGTASGTVAQSTGSDDVLVLISPTDTTAATGFGIAGQIRITRPDGQCFQYGQSIGTLATAPAAGNLKWEVINNQSTGITNGTFNLYVIRLS